MNRKIYFSVTALSLLAVCAGVPSCVDSKYRIDEIDSEVQFAANGVSLPLVTIENKTLESLLGDNDLKGRLVVGDDGYYRLHQSDAPDPFVIQGIRVPAIGGIISGALDNAPAIELDIPDFEFGGEQTQIEGLNLHPTGSFPGNLAALIPGGVGVPPRGDYGGTVSDSDGRIEINVAGLPEQLQRINTVYLGPDAKGSLVSMTVDLGAIRQATESLTVGITVELPARYTLALAGDYGGAASVSKGANSTRNNVFELTGYEVPNPSVSNLSVEFYIAEVELGTLPITGGNIEVDEPFDFTVDYTLTTDGETSVDLNGAAPGATITGQPEFRDAVFAVNEIQMGTETELTQSIPLGDIELGDIPSEISALKMVGADFSNGELTLKLNGFNLPFTGDPAPGIRVTFPETFEITAPAPGVMTGNVLTIPLGALQEPDGYELTLNGLTWAGDAGVLVDEKIGLGDIEVEFVGELKTQMIWSEDIANLDIPQNIDIDIVAKEDFALSDVRAMFDMEVTEDIESIDLSNFVAELGDSEVTAALLPPALTIDIMSPAGITVAGQITIDPRDGDGNTLQGVEPVVIPITIGPDDNTKLFIADDNYDGTIPAGYEPVREDLEALFMNIPHSIAIGLEANTNGVEQRIPLDGEDITISVDYAVDMPLGFGSEMDILLKRTEDLGTTFKSLADQKFKAAELSVSVELEASFPLRIADVEARLLKADGGTIPGLETYIEGAIEGPAPGESPKKSTLTIGLKVPNGGDFAALSSIGKLELTLPIKPTGDENRLKPTDNIKGRAWINLPEGIGFDLDEL